MLDAVDSACDGVLDRLGPVGVCGDPQAPSVRLVDDGPQFLVRIVLRACLSGQRHHAARNADLDQLGAVLDLITHGLADLVDSVGDAFLDRQLERAGHERGEHRRIEMSAGRRDRMSRRDDPGAVDPAGVDGLAERHVQQVPAGLDEQAEVAHRREAGPQRTAGIAHRTQHAGRRVVLHLGQAGVLPAPTHQQVDFHVHQPGQQDRVAEVDDVALGFATYPDDPVALDLEDSRPDELAGVYVDQTRCFEGQHR